jgi:hypothetical protein
MICSPNEHKYGDTDNITVEVYKRVGSGAPSKDTTTTYYGKYYKDNASTGTNFTTSSGSYTLANSKFSSCTSNIKFEIYSDSNRNILVDRETVAIVKDGNATTRDDIFDLLGKAGGTSDGIVKFTSNGTTYFGLNLDAIKTGALSVGS